MDGVASSSDSGSFPFFRPPSSKRSFSKMADDYRSSSPDSLFMSQDDLYDEEQFPQRRRLNPPTLALPPRRPSRFAGDGFDYRRPARSADGDVEQGRAARPDRVPASVIDLTEDDEPQDAGTEPNPAHEVTLAGSSRAQRLPRYSRDIIDVESEEEDGSGTHSLAEPVPSINDGFPPDSHHDPYNNQHHPRFSVLRRPQRPQLSGTHMDDSLLFVEARQRSRPHTVSRTHTPVAPPIRSVTPYPIGLSDTIDLTGDDEDVVHIESRTRPRSNLERPTTTAGVGTRSTAGAPFGLLHGIEMGARLIHHLGWRAPQEPLDNHAHEHHQNADTNNWRQRNRGEPHLRHGPAPIRFGATIQMFDYGAVAFDMGLPGGNRPATPKYEPPEDAKPGFTRSPGEDEMVVCPNCGGELAMGDTEEKQQIWVIKKCGHAYCGVCANNRTKSSRSTKKGKAKLVEPSQGPRPFKKCVVADCNEPASSRSMVHVFLGS